MVRTQLEKIIPKYLGIPYFINTPANPRQKLSVQVGKGNWKQIKNYTRQLARQQKVKLTTPRQTYNFQKKNHIGIDCSGLAYHLLNYLYHQLYHSSIRPHLVGSQGKTGPRRLSAHLLTSPPNAQPISPNRLQPGDLIRMRNGKHVLVVYKKAKNKIYYIHSSPQSRGVRLGSFTRLPPSASAWRLVCLTSPPPVPRT